MTQLEALNIAHEQLSNLMPYEGTNDDIFEADEVILKMIATREIQNHKKQMKNAPRSNTDKKRQKEIDNMFDDILSQLS